MKLRAVGQDVGGEIKGIESLSYIPANGWGTEPHLFPNVTNSGLANDAESNRKLALASVWKWYQINATGANELLITRILKVPLEIGDINYLWQIVPIEHRLATTYTNEAGEAKPESPRVWGTFWKYNAGPPENTEESDCPVDFSIWNEKGIVQFDRQVLRWDDDNEIWVEADLWLYCAFKVRGVKNFKRHRYIYTVPTGGKKNGAGMEIIKDPTLILKLINKGGPGELNPPNKWEYINEPTQLDKRAASFTKAAILRYAVDGTQDRTYNGLILIKPDGAIRQIQWTIDDKQGTETRACRINRIRSDFDATTPTP
jgi:hypothetical protein